MYTEEYLAIRREYQENFKKDLKTMKSGKKLSTAHFQEVRFGQVGIQMAILKSNYESNHM